MANQIRNASQYFDKNALPLRVLRETINGKTERHSHTFYVIVLVQSGYGYHIINNKAEFIVSGSLAAVSPGVSHTFASAVGLELIHCIFTPELLYVLDKELRKLPYLSELFKPGGFFELNPTE